MSGHPAEAVAAAYREACRAELRALKPGNVHAFAHGHRMTVADFEQSADASAGPLARPGARVGERVLGAVRATVERVGTNTNLGIVLLCAPLAAAAERGGADLRASLGAVLGGLDRADAEAVYAAIRLAAPAGLGAVPDHDVRAGADADLLTAMRAASAHDRIARAYATGFEDVFTVGFEALAAARRRGLDRDWCTSALYLAYLAAIPDTHIRRKYGPERAEAVRAEAAALVRSLDLAEAPIDRLLAFDRDLKEGGLNPGTSADFTVATLFADALKSSP